MDYLELTLNNLNGENQTLFFLKESIEYATYFSGYLELTIKPYEKREIYRKVNIYVYDESLMNHLSLHKDDLNNLRRDIKRLMKIKPRSEKTLEKKLIDLTQLSSEFTHVSDAISKDIESAEKYWFIKDNDRENMMKKLQDMGIDCFASYDPNRPNKRSVRFN